MLATLLQIRPVRAFTAWVLALVTSAALGAAADPAAAQTTRKLALSPAWGSAWLTKPAKPTPVSAPAKPTPVSAPAPSSGLKVGIVANTLGMGPSDQNAWQAQIASTGVRWTREELTWASVEPTAGRLDWSRFDGMMINAARNHLMVLPLLSAPPAWAGAGMPADPSGFATFVSRVVARYGPGGTFWAAHPDIASYAPTWFEVWNEPWVAHFSGGSPDPARYARLVKASVAAGRSANSSARFLIDVDLTSCCGRRPSIEWIDSMYRAVPDLGSWFDAVAVHPYGSDAPDTYNPDDARWQFRRIELIRDKFVAHGDGAKHFWITEIGWPTCARNPGCVSESQQATYLSRTFALIAERYSSYVDAVFWYSWRDWSYADPADKESAFGLIRPDTSRKPAYAALAAVAAKY